MYMGKFTNHYFKDLTFIVCRLITITIGIKDFSKKTALWSLIHMILRVQLIYFPENKDQAVGTFVGKQAYSWLNIIYMRGWNLEIYNIKDKIFSYSYIINNSFIK